MSEGAAAASARAEAQRQLSVCNACRYCEGLCAVFPAMTLRPEFSRADVDYLANLCHDCGACYDDCQFAPPHEFRVDLPATFARVRIESYRDHAWPRALAGLFERNGLVIGAAAATSVAAFLLGLVALTGADALVIARSGPGTFYALIPHSVMLAIFGAAFAYALLALLMSARRFPRGWPGGEKARRGHAMRNALAKAGSLEYLDGGGAGCDSAGEARANRRRLFHHLSFYGFALCFASTGVATLFHYVLGREAPYAWYELPVLLGTIGGIGLLIGPLGLAADRQQRARARGKVEWRSMDAAFIVMLFLTSLSGLLLLALRATPAMGTLLAVHLGVVFALFVTLPYSKFVHGLYRFLALVRFTRER